MMLVQVKMKRGEKKKKVFSVRWCVFMNEISSYIALGFDIIFALSVVIDENIHE